MSKSELLATYFARCFREYRHCASGVRAAVEQLATTASNPSASSENRSEAVSELARLLFPDGAECGFAARVTTFLRQKGMSQRDLAKAMRSTEQAISQMLSGRHRPGQQTVIRIAAALGVRPDEL